MHWLYIAFLSLLYEKECLEMDRNLSLQLFEVFVFVSNEILALLEGGTSDAKIVDFKVTEL